MTLATQIALTATPLSAYFYALGVFHAGKQPRMISGPADVGLLMLGAGGLVAFGPFGQAVMGRVMGRGSNLVPWSIWVGLLAMWAFVFAASAVRRISIYNVSADELDRALRLALRHLDGQYVPTLHGYEDRARQVGLTVTPSPRFHAAGIEAYGKEPEVLVHLLKPWLRRELELIPRRPTAFSHAMFGLAALVMITPLVGYVVVDQRAKDTLRALLQGLRIW